MSEWPFNAVASPFAYVFANVERVRSLADVGLVAVGAAATLGGARLTIRAQRRLDERHAVRDRSIRGEDALRAEKSTLDAIYLGWLLATLAAMLVAKVAAAVAHAPERTAYLQDEYLQALMGFNNVAAAMILHAQPDVIPAAEAFGRTIGDVNFERARAPAELDAAADELSGRLRFLRELRDLHDPRLARWPGDGRDDAIDRPLMRCVAALRAPTAGFWG
jgi:hypothetical protein